MAGRAVGLGWYVREADGARLVGHDGVVNGQQFTLLLVPSRGVGLAVLTNSNRGAEVAYEVATWLLAHELRLSRPPAFDRYLAVIRQLP